jgi:hypothetical protein
VKTTDVLRGFMSILSGLLDYFSELKSLNRKGKEGMRNSFTQYLPAFGVYGTAQLWLLHLCHLANEGLHWPRAFQVHAERG